MSDSKKTFGGIRHHYWEWPIASYLFLGGLGGGIFALTAIFAFFVYPSAFDYVGLIMAWPCFIALACLAFGCFLLVFELGQPLVFLRCFIRSTSIICWGARLLTVCLIFGVVWFASYVSWDWFLPVANWLIPYRGFCLALAGLSGAGVILYTGIMLSSLKAHSFWATPALPVLFTISALSTACACITLSAGWWPVDQSYMNEGVIQALGFTGSPLYLEAYTIYYGTETIKHMLHMLDIILVVCEVVVLFVMVLSFLGAGNKTANRVAKKWVIGSWKWLFWIGMICGGLVVPEIFYLLPTGQGNEVLDFVNEILAPAMVLCGGLLLRFMIVYSDERAPLPGENIYYGRLNSDKAPFLHRWVYGENEW